MATNRINLTEWLPDQPSTIGALVDINNTVPLPIGYSPFPTAVDYSNAASENLNNVYAGKFSTVTQLFAGGATKLFKFDPGTLNLANVSKTGNYSSIYRWSFVQFGDVLLAANNDAKIQAWTVNSSSLFADVSASAPICKYITVIRDFVVAANISGAPNKVQWSDINDETDWTSGGASQSDYQIISDGGNIQGITGGEFGLVLLERGIVRMSYIGSPLFFQFDTISRGLGCTSGATVAQYGQTTYFLSDDGFYSCDGINIKPIGTDKIDKWFFTNCELSQIDSCSTAIDPIKNIVVWNFVNVNAGRTLLMYNWQTDKWSKADTTVDYISSITTSGFTLEDLDAYGLLDSITTSLDSRLWVGGKLLFAGVKAAKIMTFTGVNTTATLTTGDIETGYNSVVTLARPQVENGSAEMSIASRKELDDTITYSTPVAATSEGRCPMRSFGRYHRFRLTPSGDWLYAISFDYDVEQQGTR
jgi:hypothetical protein